MNNLTIAKRAQVIGMLVEGNSLRATSRMSGVSFNTVMSILVRAGEAADFSCAPGKYFVSESCHEMLKPQVGDLVKIGNLIGEKSEEEPVMITQFQNSTHPGGEIIQRNSLAFFMPEVEGE